MEMTTESEMVDIKYVPNEREKAYLREELTSFDKHIKSEAYSAELDYISAAKSIQDKLLAIPKTETSLIPPKLNLFPRRSHFSSCGNYFLAISTAYFMKIRLRDYKVVLK